MRRARSLFLVEWDAASAEERAKVLKKEGWTVTIESSDGARAWKHMRENPPDAVAIDLSRLPSHGRETGRAVRHAKELQGIPIIFFGGDEMQQSRTAGVVPGAIFASADDLSHTLARSLLRST